MKKFVLFIFLLLPVLPVTSIERVKFVPLREFQSKTSPSYVPCPYPKNDDQIIKNLKFFLNKLYNFDGKSTIRRVDYSEQSEHEKNILRDIKAFVLNHDKSDVIKCTIMRVANQNHKMPGEYFNLIELSKKDGSGSCMRISFDASGIFMENMIPLGGLGKTLFQVLETSIVQNKLGKMGVNPSDENIWRRLQPILYRGYTLMPSFKIETDTGETLLIAPHMETEEVYIMKEVISKVNKSGHDTENFEQLMEGFQRSVTEHFVVDSVNERIFKLEEIQ